MKIKTTFLLLTAFFSVLPLFAQDGHLCSRLKSDHHSDDRSARLSDHEIDLTKKYDVTLYNLNLNLERTSTDVSGTVQIHAKAVEAMDTFLFELWDDFTIDEILLFGAFALPYTREESAVKVPVAFLAGESFFIQITYNGTPPTGGGPLGGGGMTNDFSPSWGNQVTWSLSEPFAAYEWFPCKQLLTDKADSVVVKVTTDASNMVGSNGLLEDVVDVPGGKKRYEWRSNYPIDYYLISVAVAKYVDYTVYANPVGAPAPIPIQNFIYDNPACLPFFMSDINETVDFIELYSELYGLYPFANEKYGHCMAPIGGGMEHQTMTTQGYFTPTLTAHELGHQWFGDNVTCASWSDIWLNEGFASYSEELMLAEIYPGDEITSMNDRHGNIMSEPGGSVWVEDSLNVGRIFNGRLTYDKGAAIVHTLRFFINDDALFFQVLQNYQTTYGDGTAYTADFKAIAESVTGMDFTAFFNEWYYGEGFPTYSIEYTQVGDELILLLYQSVSMPGVTPFFTNDVEIRIQKPGGIYENIRLTDIASGSQYYSIPFEGPVVSIAVDPENWIINQYAGASENPTIASLTEIRLDLEIYPNPATDQLIFVNDVNGSIFSILDVKGQMVMSGNLLQGQNTIDLSPLTKGHYFFAVNGTQKDFTKI